jgi:hypothetical protein
MIVGDTLGFLLYGQKVIEINFCRNTSGTTKPSQLGFRAHPDEESTHRGKSRYASLVQDSRLQTQHGEIPTPAGKSG